LRDLRRYVSIALAMGLVVAVVGALAYVRSGNAEAADQPVTVGFDMQTAADSPGVYTDRLPSLESCVDVNTKVNGGVFYFDFVGLNMYQVFAYLADITFTPGTLTIESSDVNQMFGPSSDVLNQSDFAPDSDGYYRVQSVDISGGNHTGSGVLARIKAEATVPPAGGVVVPVTFRAPDNPATYGVTLTADPDAYHPGDSDHNGLFEGPYVNQTGKVAVNRPDADHDGVSNDCDNCPTTANGAVQADEVGVGDQSDADHDGKGDACDSDGGATLASLSSCVGANCADADADGWPDAIDNCPAVSNYSQADFDNDGAGNACDDSDGDTFTDQQELFVGTNPNEACAATQASNDEAVDATPFDNDDNGVVNGQDILAYVTRMRTTMSSADYSARLDVTMDGAINGPDVLMFGRFLGQSCAP
jgi:Thrombospondin type 3 repeat